MNWVTRVRNAIPFIAKRETAETLWHKCKGCNTMIFLKEYEENQSVCPKCDFHGRIGPAERFAAIFDADSFTVLPMPRVVEDPLKFKDSKKYPDRIKAARAATGEQDAMVSARGTIDGHAAVVSVQDFAFMGGSKGMA
ncbi:MAG TPA: acetyl-CoA carboxylase carboxyl transferase subunit beta, partial [Sphingorhabdus sp.]|nr:acetyl-CoA carboxylase carboxyl transferase subunit beta [Sphingorhabdus sp.]